MIKNNYEIRWNTEYNIGDFQIDNEHQQLFVIAQKALSFISKSNSKKELVELKKLVFELFTYVDKHFKNEEELMKKLQYPELPNHHILHKNMVLMLKELIDKFHSLEIEEIKKRLFDFINEYFISHILIEDKKIKLFYTPLNKLRKNFGWKEIYKVNNSSIDLEHQKLFDIAGRAFKDVKDKDRTKKVKLIVVELYSYMKSHFEHEEVYMQEISYPDLESHKILHNDIIKMLNDFIKDLHNTNPLLLEKEIARIIDIVLVKHIIQEDRKIILWQK